MNKLTSLMKTKTILDMVIKISGKINRTLSKQNNTKIINKDIDNTLAASYAHKSSRNLYKISKIKKKNK